MTAVKEISGFFLSQQKFDAHIAALAAPDCATSHVRLYHNEAQHSAAVLHALAANTSVASLDIYELDPSAASQLAALLAATPRLTSLAVQHAHGQEAVSRLAAGLAANRSLSSLHVSQLDPRCVRTVAEALTAARLQHLRLDKCSISVDAAEALAAALAAAGAQLARLEVVECDLSDAAAAALLSDAAVRSLRSLISLDLSSCHVGLQACHALSQLLASAPALEALALSNNRLICCAGGEALQPGLSASRSLLRLDMASCGVGPRGAAALAAALRAGCPLQRLALDDNAVAAPGLCELLAAACGPAPCELRVLSACRNHVRGADLCAALGVPAAAGSAQPGGSPLVRGGAAAAAAAATAPLAAVPAPPPPPSGQVVTGPLEQLLLAGNALYDAGVVALVAVLYDAPALEQLDVRENGISDGGAAVLLHLVAPTRPTRCGHGGAAAPPAAGAGQQCVAGLAGLLLDGNRLHNAGGQALMDAVTAAPGLWRFSVEGNKLTDPALRLSLSQLSQVRAARHSQLVVLGRQLSSSSSDDSAARRGSGGGGGGSRRGTGGGASGGGGGGGEHSSQPPQGDQGRSAPAPMDVDPPHDGSNGSNGCSGDAQQQQQQQQASKHQHNHNHKHRLDARAGRADGGGSSSDEAEAGHRRPDARNVAPRSCGADGGDPYGSAGVHDSPAHLPQQQHQQAPAACGPAAVSRLAACGAHAQPVAVPNAPAAGGGGSGWRHAGGGGGGGGAEGAEAHVCGASSLGCGGGGGAEGLESWHAARFGSNRAARFLFTSDGGCHGGGNSGGGAPSASDTSAASGGATSSGGGAWADSSSGRSSGGDAGGCRMSHAGGMSASPPPAACFVTAARPSSVGGGGCADTAFQSGKCAGAAGECGHPAASVRASPQQVLPAFRKPRYKPLTPEQQRLFEDF